MTTKTALTIAASLLLFAGSAPADIRGRVVSADRPVAGATIAAVPYETPFEQARRQAKGGAEPKPFATAASRTDGTFWLAVPPDAERKERLFQVRISGPGVVSTLLADVYEASETEDLGERSLPAAKKLAGRVVDAQGQAVAKATVTLTPTSRRADDTMSLVPQTTLTEADGSFRFEEAGDTGNRLDVRAQGFGAFRLPSVKAGAVPRPIVLTPAVSVSGAVKRSDRKGPAVGALVRFEGRNGTTGWVETDANGRFTLADAPRGKGIVVADGDEGGAGESRDVALPLAEGAEIALALTPAASIEGKVVDAKTGKALPRVKIQARLAGAVKTTRSGPDGRYRLKALRSATYDLSADEPRYVTFKKELPHLAGGESRHLDLPLILGATLSGRVVDENGAPIEGAKGSLTTSGDTGIAAFLKQARAGDVPAFRTGPDGTFRASRLMPGDNQRLNVAHPDYDKAVLGGLSLAGGATKSGVAVVLPRGLVVTGIVQDTEGRPIAGAELTLSQDRSFRAGRGGMNVQVGFVGSGQSRPQGRSGADGRFEIKGVAPGDYTLQASRSGYAGETVDPVKVGEGSQPVRVTLATGATISGFVRHRDGTPAEGVVLIPRRSGAAGGPAAMMVRGLQNEPSAPDGFFSLESLRTGDTFDITIFGPNGPQTLKKDVVAPAEGLELVVTGSGRVTGVAVDAQSGRPLTDYQVSYEPDRGPGGAFRIVMRAAGSRITGSGGEKVTVHSEDGRFTLDDVPAGTVQVVVEAKGYQTARVGGIVVEEGGTRENVEVKASPGGLLKGRVTDGKSGRPLANVAVSSTSASGDMGGMPFAMGSLDGDQTTDAEGRFEIDSLAPGKYKVTAKHADYAEVTETVEVKDTGATVELKMSTGGIVAGSVLSESRQAIAGVSVSLEPSGEGGFGRFGGGGQSTVVDETGRFRFDHLTAGRYRVAASLRSQSSAPQDLVLQDGESKQDLLLTLSSGVTIRGAVTGLSDTGRAGVTVNASGPDGFFVSARTGADGRFELTGAPSGAISLQATAGDFLSGTRTARKQLTVQEGEREVEAEIAFEGGYTLSGRVTKNGRPVTDAFVMAFQQGGGPTGRSSSGRTDDAGAYKLEGLAAGTYSVNVSATGASKNETVKVDSDQTLDVVIPSARLAGTVVEAGSRQPLADATVSIELPQRGMRMSTTDSNGRFSVEDLEEKSYTLTVRKQSYQFDKRDVTAAEQGTDNLVFELSRGEGIGIQVKDGVYQIPLRGVMARVLDGAGTPVFTGTVTLDSEGRGDIPSLKAGRYTVLVDASGYAASRVDGVTVPAPTVALALTPGGTVELRVGPKTLEKGNAKATLTRGGQPFPLSIFQTDGVLMLGSPVRRLENVAPGSYLLSVEGGAAKAFNVTEGGTVVVELP